MSETTTYPDDLPEPLQVIEAPPLEEPVIMGRACPVDCPGTKHDLDSILDEIREIYPHCEWSFGIEYVWGAWECVFKLEWTGHSEGSEIRVMIGNGMQTTPAEAAQAVLDKIREVESE